MGLFTRAKTPPQTLSLADIEAGYETDTDEREMDKWEREILQWDRESDTTAIISADADRLEWPWASTPDLLEHRNLYGQHFRRPSLPAAPMLFACDVDGTLTEWDGTGNVYARADTVEFIKALAGMKPNVEILIWSAGGQDYAADMAVKCGVADYADYIDGKGEWQGRVPDVFIDDDGTMAWGRQWMYVGDVNLRNDRMRNMTVKTDKGRRLAWNAGDRNDAYKRWRETSPAGMMVTEPQTTDELTTEFDSMVAEMQAEARAEAMEAAVEVVADVIEKQNDAELDLSFEAWLAEGQKNTRRGIKRRKNLMVAPIVRATFRLGDWLIDRLDYEEVR